MVSLPTPLLPDLFQGPSLNWGIIGLGNIASVFARTLHANTNQRIVAVASRNHTRAERFAKDYGVETWVASYEALVADPNVDAVYVATPQHLHKEHATLAIAAGKHVLIEKPLAHTAADARAIHLAAKGTDRLVMEALWSMYLPQADILRRLLQDGMLGKIRYVQADLGQDQTGNERIFSQHGGGVSHDVGIYCTAFISSVLSGAPSTISAVGELTADGVDKEISITSTYENEARGLATSSMVAFTPSGAWIDGEQYSLRLQAPFVIPTTLDLLPREFNAIPIASWSDPSPIRGHDALCYQASYFAQYAHDGMRDSQIRPLSHSVTDIETISEARHQIGAVYPGETDA